MNENYQLVLRLQENDSQALAEILEKEDNQIFGYARKRLPDHRACKSSSKNTLSIGHVNLIWPFAKVSAEEVD